MSDGQKRDILEVLGDEVKVRMLPFLTFLRQRFVRTRSSAGIRGEIKAEAQEKGEK